MKHLLTATLLFLTATCVFARPDLSNGRRGPTPYDPYCAPVDAVMRHLDGPAPSFQTVSALVREGYSFRYVFDAPYLAQTPQQTEARHSGDCKAKSLWLASRMNDANVRYVIGKARRTSKISHAWLMWKAQGRWWILDPTNVPTPIPADSVGPDDYIVHYSYDRTGSFCHNTGRTGRTVAGRG
ncbi:MAG: hypothetical protein PHQ12_12080 [Chthoniobacteraceae bacterium]|nr:hypothetical protein [Chthoniobacteraceae bacterium]